MDYSEEELKKCVNIKNILKNIIRVNQENNLGDTFSDVKKHIDANRGDHGDHVNNSPANQK